MSLNRENIIWKSGDKWYIGFFFCWVTGEDYEWDVEYDFSSFEWASGPHQSEQEARVSWHGANPGMHIIKDSGGEKYDAMFQDYLSSRQRKIEDLQRSSTTTLF